MTNFVLVPPKGSQPAKKASHQPVIRKPSGQRDYILLDRSGSMAMRWEEALGAVNTYVRTLTSKGVNSRITAAVFDGKYHIVRRDIPLAVCAPITSDDAAPRGGTALNDAIGRIVTHAKTDNPEKAAIVIMTDGEENANHELTTAQAAALLSQCRLRGWQVIFLGIDHDNTDLARRYGASPSEFIAATKESVAAVMAKVAEKRATHGQTGQRISFTDAEKKDAGKFLLTGR
jgi:hypothetical protein